MTVAMSQATAALFSAGRVHESIVDVMEMAVADIEGCDFAALVVMDEDGLVSTPAHSDPAVAEIGFIQSPSRGGVLIHALASETALYVADLADGSWSDMAEEAEEAGIRGLLMLPLVARHQPGALALLARHPWAFGVLDRARGLLMAYLAGVALAGPGIVVDENRSGAALQSSLGVRELISQAQGILMEREHITGDQAFDLLCRASIDLNMKTREVARALIESGEWPDPRRTRRRADS
jgi:hypothetical protein